MKRSNILGLLFCIIALLAMAAISLPAGRYFLRNADEGEKSTRQFGQDIPKIIAAIASDPKKGEFILTMEHNRRSASDAMEKSFGGALCGFSVVFLTMAIVIGSALYQTVRKPKESACRSRNLIWAAGFSLIFPVVYVPLWMMGLSTEFLFHADLWKVLFIGGVFFYGICHSANQSILRSIIWIIAFAAASYLAGLLFDFIRYPSDMTRYLGETVLTSLYFFTAPSFIPAIIAFFVATGLRRWIGNP